MHISIPSITEITQTLRLSAKISAYSAVNFLTAEFTEKKHAEKHRERQELTIRRPKCIYL